MLERSFIVSRGELDQHRWVLCNSKTVAARRRGLMGRCYWWWRCVRRRHSNFAQCIRSLLLRGAEHIWWSGGRLGSEGC